MVLTFPPFFPHRRNRDGSFDSICLKCLVTTANERTDQENNCLVAAETKTKRKPDRGCGLAFTEVLQCVL
jgi:hypothetical protein